MSQLKAENKFEFYCDHQDCEYGTNRENTLAVHKTRKHNTRSKKVKEQKSDVDLKNIQHQLKNLNDLVQKNGLTTNNSHAHNAVISNNTNSQIVSNQNNVHNTNIINITIDAKTLPEFNLKHFEERLSEGMQSFTCDDLSSHSKSITILGQIVKKALHDKDGFPTVVAGDTSRNLFKRKTNDKILNFEVETILKPFASNIELPLLFCATAQDVNLENQRQLAIDNGYVSDHEREDDNEMDIDEQTEIWINFCSLSVKNDKCIKEIENYLSKNLQKLGQIHNVKMIEMILSRGQTCIQMVADDTILQRVAKNMSFQLAQCLMKACLIKFDIMNFHFAEFAEAISQKNVSDFTELQMLLFCKQNKTCLQYDLNLKVYIAITENGNDLKTIDESTIVAVFASLYAGVISGLSCYKQKLFHQDNLDNFIQYNHIEEQFGLELIRRSCLNNLIVNSN